ncbi:MAG: hypothetical protein K6G83_07240 [Lachnospiraceae bacterium]|nr:hypothetical protein [Lachnospiraceae bacterium]
MDKLTYQVDLLTAMNEKLCDTDRMHKLIALSTGELYIYWNYRHHMEELVGPWEAVLHVRPANIHDFIDKELPELILESDQELFRDQILNLPYRGEDYSEATIRFKSAVGNFHCRCILYRDEKGTLTDRLIAFQPLG